jgi:integrase
MAIQKLTSSFVQNARAEPGKERSIFWDAGLSSFGLMVTRSGAKSFVVQYRSGQVSRRYTFASALGLDNARKEARKLLGEVAKGADPVADRRKASSPNSLQAICENYLSREGHKLRSAARRKADLERLVYPSMGSRPIEAIKRSDITALLDTVEDERGAAMADSILGTLRKICSWHAIRDDRYVPPFVRGMMRRTKEERKGRNRILSDDELRRVWKAAERFPGPWSVYIRFLLLTACRRTEAAGMTWDEISDGVWTIPAKRFKTGDETAVPLSKAALKLLAGIPRIQDCPFVFTSSGRRPITNFSFNKLQFDIACGVKDWRLHDLRRTARSLMSRAGVNADIAERCLGHVIPGVQGVYDKHPYLPEMRGAFEALAKEIVTIV